MATKVKNIVSYEGGVEGSLSDLAGFLLFVGWAGLIPCIIVAFIKENYFWFAPGILVLIQGIAFSIILKGGAEIIRLLKKQNGLPYGGEIKSPSPITKHFCSECNSEVAEEAEMCKKCKQKYQ